MRLKLGKLKIKFLPTKRNKFLEKYSDEKNTGLMKKGAYWKIY